MSKFAFLATAGLVLASLSAAASANTNLVQNGGFEAQNINAKRDVLELFADTKEIKQTDGWVAGHQTARGWKKDEVRLYRDGLFSTAADGRQYVGLGELLNVDGISQSLATTAGSFYSLSFALNTHWLALNPLHTLQVSFGDSFSALVQKSPLFNLSGDWQTFTFEHLRASSASTLLSFNNVGGRVYLDNVSVIAAPVPEPQTWAMLAAGLGVVVMGIRRRSNAQ